MGPSRNRPLHVGRARHPFFSVDCCWFRIPKCHFFRVKQKRKFLVSQKREKRIYGSKAREGFCHKHFSARTMFRTVVTKIFLAQPIFNEMGGRGQCKIWLAYDFVCVCVMHPAVWTRLTISSQKHLLKFCTSVTVASMFSALTFRRSCTAR